WSIAGLLPGRYEVRVDETGFQPYRSAALTLAAGQQQTNDITLQPVAAPPPTIPPPPVARPPALPPAPQPPGTPAPVARATLRGTVRVGRSTRSNVTVNVVNLESQNERQAISEVDGTWSVAGLQPGRYEVRVDDASYRPYRSGAITLTSGQQRTADISLQEVAR